MNVKERLCCFTMIGWTGFFSLLSAQEQTREVVALSDAIGPEIDGQERERYRLFPDIEGFQSARILQDSESWYRLEYEYRDKTGRHRKTRTISAAAVEQTRLHIGLVESYQQVREDSLAGRLTEADMMYRLGLKYGSQGRYELAAPLFNDLLADYPGSGPASKVKAFQPGIDRLRKSRQALIWEGALLDQNGRTDLLIFSAYYGLWLGIATPLAFESESSQAYAAGLLLGGPLSVLLTHQLTKEANISEGRATIIEMGGQLGTWQGLGWASIADDDEDASIIGIGEIVGLGGIAAASILTSKVHFSEGHAALTASGQLWGAWLGAIFAALADHEDEDFLRDMLLGSDALVLATGVAARNVRMSETRVRLINLAGLLGAVAGFGVDLLIEVDDARTALMIAGLGSLAGAWAGTSLTRNLDQGKDLARLDSGNIGLSGSLARVDWKVSPQIIVNHAAINRSLTPGVGIRLSF